MSCRSASLGAPRTTHLHPFDRLVLEMIRSLPLGRNLTPNKQLGKSLLVAFNGAKGRGVNMLAESTGSGPTRAMGRHLDVGIRLLSYDGKR